MAASQPSSNPRTVHHPTLWLSDGNIVLTAVSMTTKDTVAFRVHKSVLSRSSTVFNDMFSLENNEAEKFDGLPLVAMPDDAEDVESLLKALYDPWCAVCAVDRGLRSE